MGVNALRVRAKTSTGQEAYFEQNDPHPDPPVRREREQAAPSLTASKAVGYADRRRTILPLPSDGRGPG